MKSFSKRILLTCVFITIIVVPNIFLYVNLHLTNPEFKKPWALFKGNPSNEILISWESEDITYPGIKYGISKDNLDLTEYNTTKSQIHHFELNGLTPNTKYYYQVGYYEEIPTISSILIVEFPSIFEFYTAPSDNVTEFSFMAISDTQQMGFGSGFVKRIADKVGTIASDSRFVMNIGDIVETGDDEELWADWFENSASYLGKSVFLPVIGNHDSNLGNISPSPKPVEMLNYFPISASPNYFYYSFNYSMVHFTIAQFTWPEESELGEEQINWLIEDLKNSQSMPFVVMSFHCPIHDSAFFGEKNILQSQLRPILDEYNVSLILNGHDHHYERIEEYDMTYLVLGGGGTLQDPILVPIEESQIIEFGPNFIHATANSTHLKVQARSLQDKIIDEFVLTARNIGGSI